MAKLTVACLAPNETAILARTTPDGLADVQLWWNDPAAPYGLCHTTWHTSIAGAVANLHACGCTVRALDDLTRKTLATITWEMS